MGKKSRDKGARAEREIINLINAQLGLELERNPYRQCKEAGHYDVVGFDAIAIEVKRYATATQGQVYSWWAETCEQASSAQVPVLCYRADRQDWRVVVPLHWARYGFGGWPSADNQYLDLLTSELTVPGFCDLLGGFINEGELFQ